MGIKKGDQMVESDKLGKKLSYESYCCLRQGGESAIKVYQAWKEHYPIIDSPSSAHQALSDILPLAVAIMTIAGIFHSLNAPRIPTIWITSPSGKTTKQLPLYQALRVIKKRKWRFTQVAPIKAEEPISRKNALKILLIR